MSDKREAIRRKQDKLLELCKRHNIPDYMLVSSDAPRELTVGSLRQYVFPSFEGYIDQAIAEIERWDRD